MIAMTVGRAVRVLSSIGVVSLALMTPLSAQVDEDCNGDAGLFFEQQDMANCEEFDPSIFEDWIDDIDQGNLSSTCAGLLGAIQDAMENDRFFWYDSLDDVKGYHLGDDAFIESEENRVYFDRQYFQDEPDGDSELLFHEAGAHHDGIDDENQARQLGQQCAQEVGPAN